MMSKFATSKPSERALKLFGESDRQNGERDLEQELRDLEDFFENASVGLHWVGPNGIILRVNQAELDMLGYRREEFVGRHISEFHVDQVVVEDILMRLTKGEKLRDYPARMRCKDGSVREVLITSSALFRSGEFIHTRCITHDITERKQAEDALRLGEARFTVALRNARILVYTTDTDLRYTWVYNPHPAFKPEDVLGRRDDQLLTPEQAEPLIALKRDALESGVGRREEFAVVVDGQLHVYDLTVEPLRDSDGAVVGLTAAAMDITEHKRAEAALRESEARLQLALRASKGGAWDWDITRNVASVSDSYRDLYGLRPDQAVDFNVWLSIVHPEDRERCRLYCEQYFQSGTDFTLDFRIVHPQLGERWLAGYGWLERTSAGQTTRFVGINLDITERKQAEERLNAALAQRTEEVQRAERHLATAQRMAAVGTMAAGLAHDMSNVLMPLSARLDALLDHAGGGALMEPRTIT